MTAELRRFCAREDGVATIFACFMIMMMVLVGGIGVDLMSAEMERVKRQNALDTATLAAANTRQHEDARDVFANYMAAAGYENDYDEPIIVSDPGLSSVLASSPAHINTRFMSLINTDTLPVYTRSQAARVFPNVEISLVLDISGSMAFDGRIESLRPAARKFVDALLNGPARDYTTINLIPYGGQVNIGDAMFEHLGGQWLHMSDDAPEDYAPARLAEPADTRSCLKIDQTDVEDVVLPKKGTYEQVSRYAYWRFGDEHPWCPTAESRVIYNSANADELKTAIDNMTLSDGTGTQFAVYYGMALLDPDVKDDFATLRTLGDIGPGNTDRPLPYAKSNKYIVLMTDGIVSEQFDPRDPFDPRLETSKGRDLGRAVPKTVNLKTAGKHFLKACDLAKATPRDITIYTVAMVSASQIESLQKCASSPAHFFRVDNENIADAFEMIGRNVTDQALALIK